MIGRPSSNLRRAIPAILLSCFIYAILSAAIKKELPHLSIAGILFWRYTISIVLFIPWMLYQTRGTSCDLKSTSFRLYFIRVGGSVASVYLYCAALKTLSIGIANLLFNTLPLFIPVIAYLWKKVPIPHRIWWGFGVALIGVYFVLSPHHVHWNIQMLFATCSGVLGALSFVALRYAHYEEPPYRVNFYFFLFALILAFPLTFFDWSASWKALSLHDMPLLLLIGVTGFLYQQSFSFALRHAPVRFLAPFMYSTVVWGMLLDRWIWEAVLTSTLWIGTALIILGNILIYLLYPKKDLSS